MSSDSPVPPGQQQQTTTPAHSTGAKRSEPPVVFTRAAALWTSLIAGFLILIVLLIFISQNIESVPFTFLGWHWRLPLGVAILLAAVCGGLITVFVGTARIYQLRRAAKRHGSVRR